MPNDALDAYEKDWGRRKAISDRYGRGSLAVAALAFVSYLLVEGNLPEAATPQTAHVYRILYVGRTYGRGPTFVYGTHAEQVMAIAAATTGIVFALTALVVYYIYNPGALYRGTRSQFRE